MPATSCDVRNGALYPFGYGLVIPPLSDGSLQLSSHKASVACAQTAIRGTTIADITATHHVFNTGRCAADEIVQLYIEIKWQAFPVLLKS